MQTHSQEQLEKMDNMELQKLFVKESKLFLNMLDNHPDSLELEKVKFRIKLILDLLEKRGIDD